MLQHNHLSNEVHDNLQNSDCKYHSLLMQSHYLFKVIFPFKDTWRDFSSCICGFSVSQGKAECFFLLCSPLHRGVFPNEMQFTCLCKPYTLSQFTVGLLYMAGFNLTLGRRIFVSVDKGNMGLESLPR